jgi:hypothetical protein
MLNEGARFIPKIARSKMPDPTNPSSVFIQLAPALKQSHQNLNRIRKVFYSCSDFGGDVCIPEPGNALAGKSIPAIMGG